MVCTASSVGLQRVLSDGLKKVSICVQKETLGRLESDGVESIDLMRWTHIRMY